MQLSKDIPLAVVPAVKKRLETVNARLAKLGYEPCTLRIESVRSEDAPSSDGIKRFRQIANITLSGPEVRLGDHQVMVKIDHRTAPAQFSFFSDESSLPRRFLDATSYCEHCRIARKRNTTFVLYDHGHDRHVQVGGTCLKDFLEVSPEQIVRAMALLEQAVDAIDQAASGSGFAAGLAEPSFVRLIDYLAFVAQSVRTEGWYGARTEAGPNVKATWFHALELMRLAAEAGMGPAQDDLAYAKAARDHVDNEVSKDVYYDEYWGNLAEVARQELIDERRLAFAALIVREKHREEEQKKREAEFGQSEFFGEVGKRTINNVEVLSVSPVMGGRFGTKWLHRLRTPEGNLAVWFGSRTFAQLQKGSHVSIVGTIKGHGTYKGIKQTELTRVRPLLAQV